MLSKRILNTMLILGFAGLLILCGIVYTPRLLSAANSSNSRKLPIYCVETDNPQIAISFDSAWGNEYTQTILDILASHNVKATFFMTGQWVDSYPEEVVKIYEAGHDLGNHSQTHPYMSQLGETEQTQELMTVHNKVKELTGCDMFLFRAPYGDYNDQVISCVQANNYYPIQWDIDSLDWKDYGAQDIIKKITENEKLGNGSIILCHNGAKYITDALDTVLTTLQDRGYVFVPISQLIYKDHYYINHEGRQIPEEDTEASPSSPAEASENAL